MDFNYIYCNTTASSSKINLVNAEGKGEIINMFYINAGAYPFPVNNRELSAHYLHEICATHGCTSQTPRWRKERCPEACPMGGEAMNRVETTVSTSWRGAEVIFKGWDAPNARGSLVHRLHVKMLRGKMGQEAS